MTLSVISTHTHTQHLKIKSDSTNAEVEKVYLHAVIEMWWKETLSPWKAINGKMSSLKLAVMARIQSRVWWHFLAPRAGVVPGFHLGSRLGKPSPKAGWAVALEDEAWVAQSLVDGAEWKLTSSFFDSAGWWSAMNIPPILTQATAPTRRSHLCPVSPPLQALAPVSPAVPAQVLSPACPTISEAQFAWMFSSGFINSPPHKEPSLHFS